MILPKVTRVQADSIHMPEWTIKITRRSTWESSQAEPAASDLPKDIREHLLTWLCEGEMS